MKWRILFVDHFFFKFLITFLFFKFCVDEHSRGNQNTACGHDQVWGVWIELYPLSHHVASLFIISKECLGTAVTGSGPPFLKTLT